MLRNTCLLGIFFVFFISSAGAEEIAIKRFKIGILPYSSQAHYLRATKGIISQMQKEGFGEDKVIFEIKNAEGKKENVVTIAKEFKEMNVDVIMPIGTPAAVVTAKEIKDIPIVFSSVFDPVGSGIAASWESSGNNTTGSSTWVNVDSLVNVLRKIAPVKRIGVVYTEGEMQTVLQFEEFKKFQKKMGFTVTGINLTNAADANAVVSTLVGKVDAVFVGGGTVVAEAQDAILAITKPAKIITLTHLTERAEKGILLAVAANSFQLGELSGKKAAQVLKGVNPSFIAIEPLEQYELTFNLKTAKEMGLKVSQEFLKTIDKAIE